MVKIFGSNLVILSLVVKVCAQNFVAQKNWWFVGPFLIGKTEIDIDVLETFHDVQSHDGQDCNRTMILRKAIGCPEIFLSDIANNGIVGWSKLHSQPTGNNGEHVVVIQFPLENANILHNHLVQGLNKMTVLEFQGWATLNFQVKVPGLYQIHCPPIHSYYLDNVLYAADIYSSGIKQYIHLTRGKHHLDIRVRGKGNLQFRCSIAPKSSSEPDLQLDAPGRGSEVTDILDGKLPFGLPSWLQLTVSNAGVAWMRDLEVEVISNPIDNRPRVMLVPSNCSAHCSLAPLHTHFIPFQIKLTSDESNTAPVRGREKTPLWWQRAGGDDPCLSFQVHVRGRVEGSPHASVVSNAVSIDLRCRHSRQSFLFTYLDLDGSVVHAGAILPHRAAATTASTATSSFSGRQNMKDNKGGASNTALGGLPVLLAMSGVGVSTKSQTDSYKYKKKRTDKDYTFGYDDVWVLAPCRDGAHNWEGTGFWTAVSALEHLQTATSHMGALAADTSRVVLAGHSRGGHGVLTLSTHMPDRFQAVASASGYPDRESYGDANILFDLDLQLSHMDPLLIAVHLSTIHEHDNTQTAGNLKGFDAFVRAGSLDRTVNPFFQRGIARVLGQAGVNVTFSEKAEADHWYWDFDAPEDGGVVFDPATRAFLHSHALLEHLHGGPSSVAHRRHFDALAASRARLWERQQQWDLHVATSSAAAALMLSPSSSLATTAAATAAATAASRAFTVESWNPATFEGVRGVRILQMRSRLRKSIVSARILPETTATTTPMTVATLACVVALDAVNVARFRIDRRFWMSECPDLPKRGIALINGDQQFVVEVGEMDKGIEFCLREQGEGNGGNVGGVDAEGCVDQVCEVGSSTSMANKRRRWHRCGEGVDTCTRERQRQPHNYGPARQAFQSPFVIVVGTGNLTSPGVDDGDVTAADMMAAARYLSSGHLQASATSAPILLDTDASLDSLVDQQLNLVLVGGPSVNAIARAVVQQSEGGPDVASHANLAASPNRRRPFPVSLSSGKGGSRIDFGSCVFTEQRQGAMFTFPLPLAAEKLQRDGSPIHEDTMDPSERDGNGHDGGGGDEKLWCGGGGDSRGGGARNRLGIMIVFDSKEALDDVVSYSFSSNVPLTRAPFSNMYADYFVTGPDMRSRGLGGLQAAGFWGNDWEFDPLSGWTSIDCV